MFGINKCFGGPTAWGVIRTFDDFDLAVRVVDALRVKGGMYEVVNMNNLKMPKDEAFINNYLSIDI